MTIEYCQQTLTNGICIGMNVLSAVPLVACIASSIFISKKKSFVFEMKCKSEYEENPQLIERSNLSKMLKQVTTLITALVSIVFLVIYSQEPAVSITILAFYAIQGFIYIGQSILIQAEYKRQGQTSMTLIMNYVLNFFLQATMGILIYIENTIDSHCFALLIILQAISLVNSCMVILLRCDFSKEAIYLQDSLLNSIHHKKTSINNTLLNEETQDQIQPQLIVVKDVQTQPTNPSSILKKNPKQSIENHSFRDFSIADIHNVSSSDHNALKRRQSAQYTSSRSDTGDVRDLMNNRLTPSFHHSVKQSTVSNNFDDEPKTYLYTYRDIKVIGYKAKENSMLFVISYYRGIKEYKTDRSHKDFKYLNSQLMNELANSSLCLPQLPNRIQKTQQLDKKVLKDKMTKYNRFLSFIEGNKIESKELNDFLLPVKERPTYAPITEKTEVDAESFITNSITDSIQDSFIKVVSPKNSSSNLLKVPSTFSRSRVASEVFTREKSDSITPSVTEQTLVIPEVTIQKVEEISNQQQIAVINVEEKPQQTEVICEQVKIISVEDSEEKKDHKNKDSTLSNSTQASFQTNRYRSQTTQKSEGEEKKMILSSRKRIYEENNISFLTQSEQQSLDSSMNHNEDRQGSAFSEGQETNIDQKDNTASVFAKRQSLFNSISQVETNPNSTNTNKNSAFSFSNKEQIDQSSENIFFKPAETIKIEIPLVIIPQTKEINGKMFYEVEYYLNNKKIHNIDKRYNNFKEFHLTMKSELKKSKQIALLPELPYKPSKSSQNIIEFRKAQLAKYLYSLQTIPIICNSPIYKKFIEQK